MSNEKMLTCYHQGYRVHLTVGSRDFFIPPSPDSGLTSVNLMLEPYPPKVSWVLTWPNGAPLGPRQFKLVYEEFSPAESEKTLWDSDNTETKFPIQGEVELPGLLESFDEIPATATSPFSKVPSGEIKAVRELWDEFRQALAFRNFDECLWLMEPVTREQWELFIPFWEEQPEPWELHFPPWDSGEEWVLSGDGKLLHVVDSKEGQPLTWVKTHYGWMGVKLGAGFCGGEWLLVGD